MDINANTALGLYNSAYTITSHATAQKAGTGQQTAIGNFSSYGLLANLANLSALSNAATASASNGDTGSASITDVVALSPAALDVLNGLASRSDVFAATPDDAASAKNSISANTISANPASGVAATDTISSSIAPSDFAASAAAAFALPLLQEGDALSSGQAFINELETSLAASTNNPVAVSLQELFLNANAGLAAYSEFTLAALEQNDLAIA